MTGPEVFEVWWKTNEVTLRLEHGQSLGRIVKAAFLAGAQAERARVWAEAIHEAELVTLAQAENESMEFGFICARNSILSNLKKATLRQEAPDAT